MDRATTIHVVSEIAVLSVMFVYFDRRLRTIESNMEYLKKNYMHTFEDIYKKLELLKQGILTTQSMNHMNNNNTNNPTEQTKTKIGRLERIVQPSQEEEKIQQKKAFTTLIADLDILTPPSTQSTSKKNLDTVQEEPIDEPKVEIIDDDKSQKNDVIITENDMDEIEKLIEGKED